MHTAITQAIRVFTLQWAAWLLTTFHDGRVGLGFDGSMLPVTLCILNIDPSSEIEVYSAIQLITVWLLEIILEKFYGL